MLLATELHRRPLSLFTHRCILRASRHYNAHSLACEARVSADLKSTWTVLALAIHKSALEARLACIFACASRFPSILPPSASITAAQDDAAAARSPPSLQSILVAGLPLLEDLVQGSIHRVPERHGRRPAVTRSHGFTHEELVDLVRTAGSLGLCARLCRAPVLHVRAMLGAWMSAASEGKTRGGTHSLLPKPSSVFLSHVVTSRASSPSVFTLSNHHQTSQHAPLSFEPSILAVEFLFPWRTSHNVVGEGKDRGRVSDLPPAPLLDYVRRREPLALQCGIDEKGKHLFTLAQRGRGQVTKRRCGCANCRRLWSRDGSAPPRGRTWRSAPPACTRPRVRQQRASLGSFSPRARL